MLIEFRVSNFRSFKEEQIVTMEADFAEENAISHGGSELNGNSELNAAEAVESKNQSDSRLRFVDCHPRALLPAAVLFGSNASGKSNLLAALAFMRLAVAHSREDWFAANGFPRTAFAWSSKNKDPSLFEAVFVSQGAKYQYGFVADDHQVLEEWLDVWSDGERVSVFTRESLNCQSCDPGLTSSIENLRLNGSSLCLTDLRAISSPVLQPVIDWFHRIFLVNVAINLPGRMMTLNTFGAGKGLDCLELPDEESRSWRLCKAFLRAADLGIVDVRQDRASIGAAEPGCRLKIRHTDEEDSWLDLDQESEGTKNLVRMIIPIVQAIECGGLVLIDELESSLHPLLGQSIVELFHRRQSNPKGAQILFTTHDTRLLGRMRDRPLLRRDQIWLSEKDRMGASTIYPLTDYHSLESENVERGYLQGRYGGIPFCQSVSWDEE